MPLCSLGEVVRSEKEREMVNGTFGNCLMSV